VTPLITDSHVDVTGLFGNAVTAAFGARGKTAQHCTFFHVDRFDREFVDVCAVIVLSVGNRRLEDFLDQYSTFFGAESQNIECLIDFFAANQVGNQTALFSMNVPCLTPYFLPRRETIIDVVRLLRRVFLPLVC